MKQNRRQFIGKVGRIGGALALGALPRAVGILAPLYVFENGVWRVEAASTILKRTYSSVDDQRIVLSNSHFARLHGVSSWSKLRVALRISMTDSGGNLASTPEFFVGLCSGTTNIYKDSTTDHCVGVQTFSSGWTRNTSSFTAWYTSGGSAIRPIKKVGSTVTNGSAIGADGLNLPADVTSGTPHRAVYFVDISTGSPNYTVQTYYWTTGSNFTDWSASDFLTNAELDSPSVSQFGKSATQTIAVNEGTDGTLNAVNVYWDRTTPQIEISDLAVVKLA